MPEQSSDTTVGATTEPAPSSEVVEQSKPAPEPATTSFAEALYRAAREDGHQMGTDVTSKEETPPKPDPDEPEADVTPVEDEEPVAATVETEPPKGLSISDQLDWYKDKGEKPPWFLERISEQSATLAKRTERLEKAERERDEARAEAAKRSGPQPTRDEPFRDVFDQSELEKFENIYRGILRTAIANPNGADGVNLGKNPDGSDNIVDLDAEGMLELRTKADTALTVDIPARKRFLEKFEKQRDDYRAKAEVANAEAFQKYPEFKNPEDPFTKEAASLLKANPNLEAVLGPETLLWLGRALKGKELETNGANGTGTDAAQRILQSARTKIAPTTVKTRSLPERKGADVAGAKKNLEQRGDTESGEALVTSILSQRRGTAKRIESMA